MKRFSIDEAKSLFSKIVDEAAKGEPQVITVNGKDTVVVISIAEYRPLIAKEPPLIEFKRDESTRDDPFLSQ